jgi:ribosomal protein S18 acetylase RimI-like enzyme
MKSSLAGMSSKSPPAAQLAQLAPAVLEAAKKLRVPEADLAAFAELHQCLTEAETIYEKLQRWKEQLQDARAEVTVRQAIAAQQDAINAAVTKALGKKAAISGKDKEKMLLAIEQRCLFAGVYGNYKWPLEEVVPKVLAELARPPKRGKFALREGRFHDRHAEIRKEAYPYRPACRSKHGDPVFEATCDGEVVGYLACKGDYFDDLSLAPGCHGCGLAKALICTAARLSNRSGFLSLDVRALNLPAIALYTKLGFKKAQKSYPPFYDWHGGYSMTASAVDVAKKMPTGFDTSALE